VDLVSGLLVNPPSQIYLVTALKQAIDNRSCLIVDRSIVPLIKAACEMAGATEAVEYLVPNE
jgi:hypothetical protein